MDLRFHSLIPPIIILDGIERCVPWYLESVDRPVEFAEKWTKSGTELNGDGDEDGGRSDRAELIQKSGHGLRLTRRRRKAHQSEMLRVRR